MHKTRSITKHRRTLQLAPSSSKNYKYVMYEAADNDRCRDKLSGMREALSYRWLKNASIEETEQGFLCDKSVSYGVHNRMPDRNLPYYTYITLMTLLHIPHY